LPITPFSADSILILQLRCHADALCFRHFHASWPLSAAIAIDFPPIFTFFVALLPTLADIAGILLMIRFSRHYAADADTLCCCHAAAQRSAIADALSLSPPQPIYDFRHCCHTKPPRFAAGHAAGAMPLLIFMISFRQFIDAD
jgi:hypothetical protein